MNREIRFKRIHKKGDVISVSFWGFLSKESRDFTSPSFISGYELIGDFQYTGLKDKNGVEIYVSDILSDRWKVEVYQNDEGAFMVKFHTNPQVNKPISLKQYLLRREKAGTSICEGYRDCIVIGNIHSNPELL